VTLKRTPLATTPFEVVDTETGQTHMQCTICLGYAKYFDTLAMINLKSRRFSKARILLILPWAVSGYLRFAFGHIDCIKEHGRP
jgi:hypothetical protein